MNSVLYYNTAVEWFAQVYIERRCVKVLYHYKTETFMNSVLQHVIIIELYKGAVELWLVIETEA